MTEISPRLRKELVDAFSEMDPTGLQHFADWLHRGGAPWFLDEFAAAIRAQVITPKVWTSITATDAETTMDVERDLREGWKILAPDQPFPLDETE